MRRKITFNYRLILHALYLVGFTVGLVGSAQFAIEAGSDPYFSGVYGYPIPHHYLFGYILQFMIYLLFTRDDWIKVKSLLLG